RLPRPLLAGSWGRAGSRASACTRTGSINACSRALSSPSVSWAASGSPGGDIMPRATMPINAVISADTATATGLPRRSARWAPARTRFGFCSGTIVILVCPVLGLKPLCDLPVSPRSFVPARGIKYGSADCRRLGEADAFGDRRLKYPQIVTGGDCLQDLLGVPGAAVEERRQHSDDIQSGVHERADVEDRVQQLADTAMRQGLALQRDHNAIGRRER